MPGNSRVSGPATTIRYRLTRGEVAFADAVELRRIAKLDLGTNGAQEVPLWIRHALAGVLPRLIVG